MIVVKVIVKEPKTPKDSEVRFDPSFSGQIAGPEDSEDVWIVTGEVSGRPTLREACRRRSRACYTQFMGYCKQYVTVMSSRMRYVASPFEGIIDKYDQVSTLWSINLTIQVYSLKCFRHPHEGPLEAHLLQRFASRFVLPSVVRANKKVLIYCMLLQIHRS